LLLRSDDPQQIQYACEWADERLSALEGSGRELARLHAARLRVSCLWAAGRTDDAEAALLPIAIECERHGLIRFLLDGGPDVVAASTGLRAAAAEPQGHSAHPALPRVFLHAVLNAPR